MTNRGITTRVPRELIEEAKLIQKIHGGTFSNACRKIAKEYSPMGREIKDMDPKMFLKKVFLGK